MSKGNTFENDWMLHVFNNGAITLIGDAAGLLPSAVAGSLFASLHTADPGEAGTQLTNETDYTNYARVGAARSAGGWTVTANAAENTAALTFPTCGVTGSTVTHFEVGAESTGAGKMLYFDALASSLIINSGITPQFAIGDLDVTED